MFDLSVINVVMWWFSLNIIKIVYSILYWVIWVFLKRKKEKRIRNINIIIHSSSPLSNPNIFFIFFILPCSRTHYSSSIFRGKSLQIIYNFINLCYRLLFLKCLNKISSNAMGGIFETIFICLILEIFVKKIQSSISFT
jgi:hypothetical protein